MAAEGIALLQELQVVREVILELGRALLRLVDVALLLLKQRFEGLDAVLVDVMELFLLQILRPDRLLLGGVLGAHDRAPLHMHPLVRALGTSADPPRQGRGVSSAVQKPAHARVRPVGHCGAAEPPAKVIRGAQKDAVGPFQHRWLMAEELKRVFPSADLWQPCKLPLVSRTAPSVAVKLCLEGGHAVYL